MTEEALSQIASAIGEPSRARMLSALMDGHARTSTELAVLAGISPSTASVHLHRLERQHLVKTLAQGKHRYYSLAGRSTARAVEALLVLAGASENCFQPSTPVALRAARTCYDHMAGALAVGLHDRFRVLGWLRAAGADNSYRLSSSGIAACAAHGIDLAALQQQRRRFAYACVDWSERRPHLAGALGAALLALALRRKWIQRELDSRALSITRLGYRELSVRFGWTPENATQSAK
jgi:DNA-binding transcriptional ArsR family regulator